MPRAAILAAVTVTLVTALVASAAGVRAATVEDRYGPARPSVDPVTPAVAAPAAAPAAGWLTWARKTPAEAPAQPSTRSSFEPLPRPAVSAWAPPAQSAPERVAAAALPTSLYSPAPTTRPVMASPAPRATLDRPAEARAAAPAPWTSMGRAVSAAAPQAQVQAQTSQAPHFYSVHREFGLNPDPIPLPRQFFSDGSGDLSAPPPPPAPHPFAGSQAANSPANTAANRAREVELETADSAAN